jgi:hypothetical protein
MLNEFDPSQKTHVIWLKDLINAPVAKKANIFEQNPMGVACPAFEMIQVLFALSMKYTKAVFEGTACLLETK